MAQVAVEFHPSLGPEADQADDCQQNQEPSAAVNRVGIDAVEYSECPVVPAGLVLSEKMRQEDQGKNGGSYHSEGREDSEILQQVTLGEKQSHKGSHSGQAAKADRSGLVPENLLGIIHIFAVGEYVKAVAQGHAKHEGPDSYGHQRHPSLDPENAGKGEERPVNHRGKQQRQGRGIAEAQSYHKANQNQRQPHGQGEVLLYLA